jgi:hypothetical protein
MNVHPGIGLYPNVPQYIYQGEIEWTKAFILELEEHNEI